MAAIGGQPAPKPGSLGKPVPGKDEELTAEAFLADFSPPSAPAAPQGEAQTAESFLSDAAPPAADEIPADQFAGEPSFMEANMAQMDPGNVLTRIQTGLAANDTEKLDFLKRKFGDKNAALKDGKIYFRKTAGEKLKPLDPATLELINDILPDFAREIVTEVAMLPGEVAGATGAAAAGLGLGAPVTVPAGILAGRVASVPLANAAADKVAELAGVPLDEMRSRAAENAIGMGAEAVLPVIGRQLTKRFLPGSTAYRAAKEQGEREIVALSKHSQEVAAAADQLVQEGRAATIRGDLIGIPGANVPLMGHHMNPDSPVLKQFAAKAASDPRYINAQNQLAEDWGESLKNTLTEIGRRGNPGPLRPEELSSRVTNAVADLQKAEGKAIGQYRAKAMAKLKNMKMPLGQETAAQVGDLLKQAGFTPRRVKSITKSGSALAAGPQGMRPAVRDLADRIVYDPPKDISKLLGTMGITDIGQAKSVVNNLNEVAKGLSGGLTLSDFDRLRNTTGTTGDALFRTEIGAKLSGLSGNLRKDFRSWIASGLDDDFEKAAFNSAMDDFSSLKTNVAVLKNALNEDSSAKAIVSSLFTGKENLQKIKAIKQISPESFGALKEEWINQMMEQYASRDTKTGFKSGQFLDALDKKYGKQFVAEVLNDGPGPNLDTVRNILKVTERIEQMAKSTPVDSMSEAQKKAIADAGIGLFANIKFKAVNGITSLMNKMGRKDSPLTAILTRDGIDKYIASYPGKVDKKTLLMRMNDYLAHSKVMKAVESDAAKRGSRAIIKEEAQ